MSIPKELGIHTRYVLKTMHEAVGAPFKDVTNENWFMKYSWSEKEQDKFISWMISYLMNNKEARHEMARYPVKNKKRMEALANQFIFNYGWTIYKLKT